MPDYLENHRLMELLSIRAVEGLDSEDADELEGLAAAHPDLPDDGLDGIAAALTLAALDDIEPMPEQLRRRIEQQALLHIKGNAGVNVIGMPAASPTAPARGSSTVGWWAAAACLVLALAGWWPRLSGPGGGPPSTAVQPERAKAAEARDALMASGGSLVMPAWAATGDPNSVGASGDVVWSNALQEGYMRFKGLQANDPALSQYQLWIFDGERNEAHPVDGGVFDIPSGTDEVIVPIDSKLMVKMPTLFAVTVEPPGGVVVSSRERIVLAAQVPEPTS